MRSKIQRVSILIAALVCVALPSHAGSRDDAAKRLAGQTAEAVSESTVKAQSRAQAEQQSLMQELERQTAADAAARAEREAAQQTHRESQSAALEQQRRTLDQARQQQRQSVANGTSTTPEQANAAIRVDPNPVRIRSNGQNPVQGKIAEASDITPKVRSQMGQRGWNQQEVLNTVNHPVHTSPTTLLGGTSGTAYFRIDNHYVVRNNASGSIWAISDTAKPVSLTPKAGHFHIDTRITNPPVNLK